MELLFDRSVLFEWNMRGENIKKVSTQYGDVLYWCGQNNIQCRYGAFDSHHSVNDSTYHFIHFYNDEDLMAFKLRWT